MPIYQVHHIVPLTDEQQDAIAEAITVCHSENFKTPRLFVNVFFVDAATENRYVAGKRRKTNMIVAEVRHGPSRTQELYHNVIKTLEQAWATTVGTTGDQELRAVFLLGGFVAGAEVGFPLPEAGHDAEWLREHYAAFEKLAENGDGDFQDLVQELKTREVFKEMLSQGK